MFNFRWLFRQVPSVETNKITPARPLFVYNFTRGLVILGSVDGISSKTRYRCAEAGDATFRPALPHQEMHSH